MRQFEDADAVRRWFELADQHVTAAETARLGGRKLTQRLVNDVEFAVMSQLLRDSPIRIRTLAALRIAGDHPNITQGGSPFLVIYAADNKNFKPIKAPLSSDTKKVLTLYLAHYRYHYVQDSAGPGRFRGGLGVGMTIEALLPDTIVAMRGMGRTGFAPWGVHGGHPGALTKPAVLNAGRPDERIIPKLDILGMKRGETLTLASSGGGGYGDPLDRDIQSVRDDVIYGFVSRVQAADTYGVVFNGSTDAVDADRTRVRRETLKDQRPVTRTIYAYGAGRERHDRVWSLEGRSAILSILNGLPIPSRSNAKILIMQKALDLFAERSLESIGRREIDEAWLATRAKLGLEV